MVNTSWRGFLNGIQHPKLPQLDFPGSRRGGKMWILPIKLNCTDLQMIQYFSELFL